MVNGILREANHARAISVPAAINVRDRDGEMDLVWSRYEPTMIAIKGDNKSKRKGAGRHKGYKSKRPKSKNTSKMG